MSAHSFTHTSYAIGIVCALATEKAAVEAMLDEEHPRLTAQRGDDNDYTLGRVGLHNVAIACLPAGIMGKGAAAIVAKDMMRTFPIKIGLMVGIGGGVWSKKVDIHLGDVVVSQPTGTQGGVVQWDFGKMEKDGVFRRTGLLNKPPKVLLHALQTLQTQHMMKGNNISEHLSQMVERMPYMAEPFGYQGLENDQLFQATYEHQDGETCATCHVDWLVEQLPKRTSNKPKIHYGNIASGDKVMKDGIVRDAIAEKEGVICFEMEAAGLMDNFPCVVIRGICDYADSHKNKRWQPYAAATAAAYAKELLGVINEQDVNELQIANKHHVPFSLRGVPTISNFIEREMEMLKIENYLLPRLQTNTSDDILTIGRQKTFSLYGLGGMGKTQLAVEFARRHHSRYSAVLWLDGSSLQKLRQSFVDIATRLPRDDLTAGAVQSLSDNMKSSAVATESLEAATGSLETATQSIETTTVDADLIPSCVLTWLSLPSNTNWLLIIDNVDRLLVSKDLKVYDPEAYDPQTYFPEADHGSILITTRLAGMALSLGSHLKIDRVNDQQAKAILCSSVGEGWDETETDALIRKLDGLPLALTQAGSYLRESNMSVTSYIWHYDRTWKDLMDKQGRFPLQAYGDRSILTTWKISYNQVAQLSEGAAGLLTLWGFMDHKDLWHGLIASASKLKDQLSLPTWLVRITENELEFTEAMRLLLRYSLIDGGKKTAMYSMHSVLHSWCYHLCLDRDKSMYMSLATVIVAAAAPRRDEEQYWKLQRRLLPHALQICGGTQMVTEHGGPKPKHYVPGWAFLNIGVLLAAQVEFAEAEIMYLHAMRKTEETAGPGHPSTLLVVNNLGLLYANQGRWDKAEEMYHRALEGKEKVLGSTHISTLDTVHNLGILHLKRGDLTEAEQMFQRALMGKEKTLGKDDIQTLDIVHNLGILYSKQGRIAAQSMFQRVLQGYERTLGLEHPSTLRLVSNMGLFYKSQDKLSEAESMYSRALQGYENANVLESIDALDTINNMGVLYHEQGFKDKATVMYQRALQGYEKAWGVDSSKCRRLRQLIWQITEQQEVVNDAVSIRSGNSSTSTMSSWSTCSSFGETLPHHEQTRREGWPRRRSGPRTLVISNTIDPDFDREQEQDNQRTPLLWPRSRAMRIRLNRSGIIESRQTGVRVWLRDSLQKTSARLKDFRNRWLPCGCICSYSRWSSADPMAVPVYDPECVPPRVAVPARASLARLLRIRNRATGGMTTEEFSDED